MRYVDTYDAVKRRGRMRLLISTDNVVVVAVPRVILIRSEAKLSEAVF